jgi:methionyl-tRNA formyltransferase
MKIIFLGTPYFAVPSLDILVKNGYDVCAVITAPDKPAGRGQKLVFSDVKQYAIENNILCLQPVKLSDPDFLSEVKALNADLQIVVAFRMMPEKLWSMPKHGTFNLHGSLLPSYRGAAPINRAIMNGEVETGVTTFFLRQEIDTGNIIFQQRIEILANDNAGTLHDKMMLIGADLVLKTVKQIESGDVSTISQLELLDKGNKVIEAPKIFKADCKLDIQLPKETLHNYVRGLSPYPGAYVELIFPDKSVHLLKVYASKIDDEFVGQDSFIANAKDGIKIKCSNGYLSLLEVQMPGKKRMDVKQLLNGYHFPKGIGVH